MDKRFSIGRVIAEGGGVVKARWPAVLVSLLIVGAGPAITLLVALQGWRMATSGLLTVMLSALATATLIPIVIAPAGDPRGKLAPALLGGLRSTPAVLFLQTAINLPRYLYMAALMLQASAEAALPPLLHWAMFILAELATLGIALWLGLAPTVLVWEGAGLAGAASGSARLIARARLRVGALFLTVSMINIAMATIFTVLAQQIPALAAPAMREQVILLCTLPFAILSLVIEIRTYDELRRISRQRPQDAAEVFD